MPFLSDLLSKTQQQTNPAEQQAQQQLAEAKLRIALKRKREREEAARLEEQRQHTGDLAYRRGISDNAYDGRALRTAFDVHDAVAGDADFLGNYPGIIGGARDYLGTVAGADAGLYSLAGGAVADKARTMWEDSGKGRGDVINSEDVTGINPRETKQDSVEAYFRLANRHGGVIKELGEGRFGIVMGNGQVVEVPPAISEEMGLFTQVK